MEPRPAEGLAERRLDSPKSGGTFGALWTGTKIGALCVALYASLFHVSIVRGGSMAPGIHDGDRILVDQLSPVLGSVARGDIVILRCPLDPRYDYIKRVVALPGETVEVRHGRVWIDGLELDEPYVERQDPRSALRMVVPDDSYFVMGDNRRHSSDSREFGVVAGEQLLGVVGVRLWPLERAGALP
ncbi:MAG: signal peptidase I [Planctomycetia bacterium]